MASTTYEPLNPWRCSKSIIQTNSDRAGTDVCTGYHLGNVNKLVTFCHQFAVLGNMARNAGQLPQPFWLGAARGGGSCSLSASVARA
jgi:hypothetical protein|nr:MAG TPA: hypothetical protein [Caudoviricetes sp.]